jgi:putative ABC transport system permease protein
MAVGACLGALTALIHVRLGVNKFLAGIVVIAISYTVDLRIMDAANIGLIRAPSIFDVVEPFNTRSGLNLQLGTVLLLATLLLVGLSVLIVGINSRWGIRLRVAGSNGEYARSLGISVPRMLTAGLAITNALVGGAGALVAMYQGFADIGMGQGILILALASMTIGERILPEESFSIPTFVITAAIAGSLAYEIVIAYALRLGLAATDLKLATALFVIGIIALKMRKRDDGFLEILR